MKKLMLLSAIILNGVMISFAGKLTVDNTPGSAANYTSVVDAISNANTGDTILVYGSSYNYASFTINKKLTVVGSAGFDPEVSNENTPTVSIVTFNDGSTGSTISGFLLSYIQFQGGVNDVGIYNNRFQGSYGIYFYYGTSSNIVIEGNVFQSYAHNTFIENYGNGAVLNNILIKNNYFESLYYYGPIGQYNNTAFTYRNNIFVMRNGSASYPLCNICNGVLYENNIFWEVEPTYVDISGQQCTNCIFNNNLFYNSGGGTMTAINLMGNGVSGANNILNADPLFVNFNQNNNYTIAENYRIQDASPGNNAGTDGSDIGVYGGNYTWENRKYPKAFPHQEILNVINSSVPQGTPVNVNLKARKATN